MPTQLAGDYPTRAHQNVAKLATRAWDNLPKFLASTPVNAPSVRAFESANGWLQKNGYCDSRPLVLDSGCGNGESTRHLALAYPDAAVIGVDRSEARLGKSRSLELPENAMLVRAELASFWRLMLEAEAAADGHALAASRVQRHFLLYPNPYPKPSRLNLRWHGHPAFPLLLAIGDELELRSNWKVYLEEFATATQLLATHAADDPSPPTAPFATGAATPPSQHPAWTSQAAQRVRKRGGDAAACVEPLLLDHARLAITPFERKYHEVREPLYRLRLPQS